MYGPEHWLGLIRAWIIIGLVIYGFWTLLDALHLRINRLVQRFSGRQ